MGGRADFHGTNARSNVGATALHIAAANEEEDICKAILESERFTAGVNAECRNGQTPLDYCLNFGSGSSEAEQVLRSAGGHANGSYGRKRVVLGAEGVRYRQPAQVDDISESD